MIQIDNDYMINERGFDVRASFKGQDNPSNIADIFFKQLSHRIYDFILTNSVNFDKRSEIDVYLEKSEERVEDFKRALAEQALYMITNGDLTLMLPAQGSSYSDWLNMRISPATYDILERLYFLRKMASEGELFYDNTIGKQIGNPTRNW